MGFFDILANTAASTLPGSVIGSGMGLLLQKQNDARQLRMQQQLQNMQIAGQQQMTDYNMQKQLQMWKDTSYGAQKEQMMAANINPALMYGMSGGGGQTAGQANGSVTGAHAPAGGGEIPSMIGMGIQSSMQQAQIDLLKAQTRNLNVTADKTAGVDTTEAQSRIGLIAAQTTNEQAKQALTEIETKIKGIEERIKGKTEQDVVNLIGQELEEAYNRVEKLHRENLIGNETREDIVSGIKAEMAGKALINEYVKAHTQLTGAQTTTEKGKPAIQSQQLKNMEQEWKNMIYERINRIKETGIKEIHAWTEKDKVDHDKFIRDLSESTKLPMDIVEKIAQAIILKNLLSPGERTPIKGFGK